MNQHGFDGNVSPIATASAIGARRTALALAALGEAGG